MDILIAVVIAVFIGCMMAWMYESNHKRLSEKWVMDYVSNYNLQQKPKQSLKDVCEHSWHVLVNEHQDDQKLIVLECIKCGDTRSNTIGRCNHEWEDTEKITARSPYDVAIAPLMELAHETFKSSKKSDKFDKVVDEITDKWYKVHPTDGTFDQKIVRVKTCKRCGSIFVLDVSNSSLSSQFVGQQPEQQTTQEEASTF